MNKQSLSLGAAAVALVLSGLASAAEMPAGNMGKSMSNDPVHCYGINSCKGQAECKTASNECKGQNSCKGHGFVSKTASECKAAGGTIGDM